MLLLSPDWLRSLPVPLPQLPSPPPHPAASLVQPAPLARSATLRTLLATVVAPSLVSLLSHLLSTPRVRLSPLSANSSEKAWSEMLTSFSDKLIQNTKCSDNQSLPHPRPRLNLLPLITRFNRLSPWSTTGLPPTVRLLPASQAKPRLLP